MNIEDLREYCISVKGATESFPFNDKILVFKVMGRMFAYINIEPKDGIFKVSVKCNPTMSAELREQYEGVTHGQHTKSLTWNAINLTGDVNDNLIKELISHSVTEVVAKLSKKQQEEYYNS